MLAALLCNLSSRPTANAGFSRNERRYLRNMGRAPIKCEEALAAIAALEQLPQPQAKLATTEWLTSYPEMLQLERDADAESMAAQQRAFELLLRLAQLHAEDELILLLM